MEGQEGRVWREERDVGGSDEEEEGCGVIEGENERE